jgi:predicted RNA binding protein YcfA (HicA-like mRNA interferase family)
MKYSEMVRLLKRYGYRFDRHCRGSHEFWANESRRILVTRSGLADTRAKQNWLRDIRATAQAAA